MNIKNKLLLALLFLFGVIILVGGMGSYYLQLLAKESALILKDNQRSIQYMRQIDEKVDQIILQKLTVGDTVGLGQHFGELWTILKTQEQNLTEGGERDLTLRLKRNLQKLENHAAMATISDSEWLMLESVIKEQTANIYLLNQDAMHQKNESTSRTAKKVILYMRILVGASILVGLAFIIGLPWYISRPLKTFNRSIQEISKGNYKISIPRKSKDEFGQLASSFNTMAAKLSEYENSNVVKLLKEQKRLNAVINQFDEIVLGLDENKVVLFANEHCLKVLNMEKDQLIGLYAPDLAVRNHLLDTLIRELMIGFSPWEEKSYPEIKIVEGSQEKLFSKKIIDILEQPTGEQRNVLVGHLILLTDITDFTERDKTKTHFMAVLSHELKTPVSAIQMSTNLMRNRNSGELTDKQEDLLLTIDRNNERIRHMINEILDLSKIESGSIDLNVKPEHVHQLVDRAVSDIRPFLEEKKLTVKLNIPNSVPTIKVDAHKTVWILNNFLTNAIRYSPIGSQIEIFAETEYNAVKISVRDQGDGISRENQKRIFEKFTRLQQTNDSGTGLGLAISKEFMEAMGGSIGVESKEGSGATFWIKPQVAKPVK